MKEQSTAESRGSLTQTRTRLLYILSILILGLLFLLVFGLVYSISVKPEDAPHLLRFVLIATSAGLIGLGAQAMLVFRKLIAPLGTDRIAVENLTNTIRQLTVIDDLTKAFNRAKFESVISRELENTRRYKSVISAIMFDIDGFKAINDKHGYRVGDRLLMQLARFIRKRIRKSDYLFRWRGGKFIILTPHIDADKAGMVAEKLRQVIAKQEFADEINFTLSLGVTQISRRDSMESLLQRLQNALTGAKNKGRNQTVIARPN